MNYVRWYDKDPDLSHLMTFLQGLDDTLREEIAQDLIQILTSELYCDMDGKISALSNLNITTYRRWYDQDLALHSAIELIKDLNAEDRKEIIERIHESIVQILTDYNYGK